MAAGQSQRRTDNLALRFFVGPQAAEPDLIVSSLWSATRPTRPSCGSAPSVDRDRSFVAGAEHFPCPLRFAAGDRDVDFLRLEHLDDFVGCRLQLAGIGLDAGYRQRSQQSLHPLVIPILASGKPRIFGAPVD